MLWLDTHRRFRDRLSAYIDGELGPGQAEALEAHLGSCPDCRRHLEELRATVAALRDLPQQEVPRPFALTPQQLPRPAAKAPVALVLALTTGLRLAGVALAFALAVVLVVDLGGLSGGGGGGQEAASRMPALGLTAPQSESGRAAGTPGAGAAYGVASPSGGETQNQVSGPPQPTAAAKELEAATPSPGATFLDRNIVQPPAPEQPAALAQPSAAGGGGIDALRAAEIALALALGLTVGGIVALAYARRRTR